jgi:hypothetical protein
MRASAFVLVLCFCCEVVASDVLLREDFADLSRWQPLTFRKIKSHTAYQCLTEGELTLLEGHSKASASGLRCVVTFDPRVHSQLAWRWRITNVLSGGNALTKKGDDYPLRIYVIFLFDPDSAGFARRQTYKLAKLRYGEFPPDSTLNYIWANRAHDSRIIANAYTADSQMIVLRSGDAESGEWQNETVDILADYKAAFDRLPPRRACLAVMVDTDNTGEEARSHIDYIEIRKPRKP